mmetsp:Transcript_10176/g.20467  ORF Transcript_10176/g.20467 Transcript_10176/m.20467 type:complete len:233 (-) Transcript_10176:390-1088(-)
MDTERDASITFGLIASAAGLIGTVLGGAHIDRVVARGVRRDGGKDRRLADIIGSLRNMITVGTLICWPIVVVSDPAAFAALFFLGMSFLFAITSGINIAVMLAVDPRLKSNAIGLSTLLIHACGDVPSPIIVGALKDRLAPDCIIDVSGNFVDPAGCATQRGGIRKTLVYIFLWMTWSIVLLMWAQRIATRDGDEEDAHPEGGAAGAAREPRGREEGGAPPPAPADTDGTFI